jgi:hypothetical protein
VRITSPALISGERTVRTLENGSYRIPVLPPGQYRVMVQAPGYQAQEGRETLEMGRTSTLNFKLAAAATAEVVVVADVELAATATVSSTQNYTGDLLEALPTKRDLTSIMSMTPGIVSGVAYGGDRQNANAYLMDGINIGDPMFGTQYIYANPDWFEEVQVGGLGAPAEYGGFSGGYINSLIKRGGNAFSGSLTGYYTPDSLRADPKLSDPRLYDNYVSPPPMKAWDVALNVGGPIVKDRVWFFASLQKKKDDQTPVGAPASIQMDNPTFLGKVSWQVTQAGTMELFFEYDGLDREHRGITNLMETVASRKQSGTNRTFGANWAQMLSNSTVLTLKGTGYNGSYGLYPYQDAPAISLDVPFNGKTLYSSATVGEIYDTSRLGFQAILDHSRSSLIINGDTHAFRFGLEWERGRGVEDTFRSGGRTYYGTTQTPAAGPQFTQTDYVLKGGELHLKATIERQIGYFQDAWTINDRVTLFPGVRVERFTGRPFGWGNRTLWDTHTVAPRFGATVALTKDQRTVAKAHFGRYFDGLTVVHFDRALPGGYSNTQRFRWGTGATFSKAPFTIADPAAVPYSTTPYQTSEDTNNSQLDPDIKHPYTDEVLVGLEQKIGQNWTFGLTGTYRVSRRLMIREDRLLAGGFTGQVYDPVTGNTLPVFDPANPKTPTGAITHDYIITNADQNDSARNAKRDYKAASLTWNRRMAGNWFTQGSLTFALRRGNLNRSNGYDDAFANPNYQVNFEGKLPGYNDVEFKWRGGYTFPWKMRVSGSFTYLSGERYTRTLASPTQSISGAQYTLFAETRGASRYPSRHLLDLQVNQNLSLGKRLCAELFLDFFNVLNNGTPLSWTTRSNDYRWSSAADDPSATWINRDYLKPTSQEDPRSGRVGLRLKF